MSGDDNDEEPPRGLSTGSELKSHPGLEKHLGESTDDGNGQFTHKRDGHAPPERELTRERPSDER